MNGVYRRVRAFILFWEVGDGDAAQRPHEYRRSWRNDGSPSAWYGLATSTETDRPDRPAAMARPGPDPTSSKGSGGVTTGHDITAREWKQYIGSPVPADLHCIQ